MGTKLKKEINMSNANTKPSGTSMCNKIQPEMYENLKGFRNKCLTKSFQIA